MTEENLTKAERTELKKRLIVIASKYDNLRLQFEVKNIKSLNEPKCLKIGINHSGVINEFVLINKSRLIKEIIADIMTYRMIRFNRIGVV